MDCMTEHNQSAAWKHRIARTLRRLPFITALAFQVWRRLQPRYTLGAVGVLINTDGRILLVEHAFHPKTPWGLPGGWVGRGEDPAITVQRELHEELAINVDVGPLLLAETPFPRHLDLAYLCRSDDLTIPALSYELLAYDWFKSDQMPRILSFHYRAIQRALEVSQSTETYQWLQH